MMTRTLKYYCVSILSAWFLGLCKCVVHFLGRVLVPVFWSAWSGKMKSACLSKLSMNVLYILGDCLGYMGWLVCTRDSVWSACGDDLPSLSIMARSLQVFPSVSVILYRIAGLVSRFTLVRTSICRRPAHRLCLNLCNIHI